MVSVCYIGLIGFRRHAVCWLAQHVGADRSVCLLGC